MHASLMSDRHWDCAGFWANSIKFLPCLLIVVKLYADNIDKNCESSVGFSWEGAAPAPRHAQWLDVMSQNVSRTSSMTWNFQFVQGKDNEPTANEPMAFEFESYISIMWFLGGSTATSCSQTSLTEVELYLGRHSPFSRVLVLFCSEAVYGSWLLHVWS